MYHNSVMLHLVAVLINAREWDQRMLRAVAACAGSGGYQL